MIVKIIVDVAMTVALLLLMAYELIGQAAHEWIGISMLVLFVLHHVLNSKWNKNILKDRYTMSRIIQTVLVALVLLSMLGSMISGVILSRHALSFLLIDGGQAFARTLHMLSGYWSFVFMSLHLGFHWNMIMRIGRRTVKKPSKSHKWMIRIIKILISGYGAWAFMRRDIGSYMFLKNQFVFFNFEEPITLFLLDYIAVIGLFVMAGHYFYTISKRQNKIQSV